MMIDFSELDNIIIIQTAFIGDVALSIYLAEKVKALAPKSNLYFITTPQSQSLVKCFDSVDHVIEYDKRNLHKGLIGIKSIIKKLGQNDFDLALVPHKSFRSAILTKFIKPKISVSFNNSQLSFLYSKRANYQLSISEIDKNFLLLSTLTKSNYKYEGQIPKLKFNENDKNHIHELINKKNYSDFVCISPGSIWFTKQWKEHHLAKLIRIIRQHNLTPILMGSNSEVELCNRINKENLAINLAGKTTLPQMLILMSYSKAVISNDSAPTHFAGILNIPVVSIFGPTIREFGFAPHRSNSRIAEVSGLSCRPCSIHGEKSCPIKTHACMEELQPEQVFLLLQEIL